MTNIENEKLINLIKNLCSISKKINTFILEKKVKDKNYQILIDQRNKNMKYLRKEFRYLKKTKSNNSMYGGVLPVGHWINQNNPTNIEIIAYYFTHIQGEFGVYLQMTINNNFLNDFIMHQVDIVNHMLINQHGVVDMQLAAAVAAWVLPVPVAVPVAVAGPNNYMSAPAAFTYENNMKMKYLKYKQKYIDLKEQYNL